MQLKLFSFNTNMSIGQIAKHEFTRRVEDLFCLRHRNIGYNFENSSNNETYLDMHFYKSDTLLVDL